MYRMLRSRPRVALVGTAVAALVAGVLTSPAADAHPDPLEGARKQQVAGGIVVRVNSPHGLAAEYEAVQWGSTGELTGQTAELVYAGSGCSPASYAGIDVAGKIALVDQTTATDPCPIATFFQKVQSAERAGAIGLVAIPREGAEPRSNATAITASIPALEVHREPFLPVREAVLAEETVNVALDDTREPLEAVSDAPCVDGMAGPFECEGIDLLSFTPRDTFGEGEISDVWGWTDTDPDTGAVIDEYVMFGKTDGVGFMRVTEPRNPVYLGALPNPAVLQEIWHDIKVYNDHAFIVSESTPHGMTIFDLKRLGDPAENAGPEKEWDADAVYPYNVSAHNIAINEDTGFAYIVGGSAALVVPDQCLSGLHMIDIQDPKNPSFAGCYLVDGGPGTAARVAGSPVGAAYIHDTQCVVYDGPDTRYTGRELCFNAAEDQVTIADVTDKENPVTVGTTDYEGIAYAHQGWLTEDHRFLLTNDELDEMDSGTNTRTVVLDVSDLENPKVHTVHTHETESIDHNNYVKDGLVYQSNYTSGLQVLDVATLYHKKRPRLDRVAFFDTYPYSGAATFDGTWSNYPYFDSGTIAVTGIGEGIFLLALQDHVAGGEIPDDGKGKGRPDHAGPPDGRGPKG
jgi:choice-of-anchor B domain-containing protein